MGSQRSWNTPEGRLHDASVRKIVNADTLHPSPDQRYETGSVLALHIVGQDNLLKSVWVPSTYEGIFHHSDLPLSLYQSLLQMKKSFTD